MCRRLGEGTCKHGFRERRGREWTASGPRASGARLPAQGRRVRGHRGEGPQPFLARPGRRPAVQGLRQL